MKSAKTLYWILNSIIFLLLLGIGLGVFFFTSLLFGIEQDIIHVKEDITNFKTETKFYLFTILKLGVYVAFVVALLKWKKVTKLLISNDFYNKELIESLFSSGKIMIVAALSSWCIDWLSNLFLRFKFIIALSEKSLIYLLIIAIGLFLMLISVILKDTKVIKEENELTI